MQFKALCDIEANVQLFIDYKKDVKVDTSQYINKNLVLVS